MYNGPNIVTDGLVLALDAANNKSYPGSGTSISDLTGNTSAITINSPSFITANGGGLQCSTNEFIVADDKIATDYVSVEVFYKRDANEGGEDIVFNKESTWELRDDNNNIQWAVMATNRSWFWYNTGIDVTVGETTLITLTYDGSSVKTYKNGVLDNNEAYPAGGVLANQTTAYPKFNSRNATKTSVQNPGNRTCFIFNIYDRSLTPSEVLQNYNATKSRFGL
jgi:hypothetical protein